MGPKRLTLSQKKRNKAALARKKRAEEVRIGDQIDSWRKIKEENELKI